MIARLVALYIAIFTVVLAALSFGAYSFVDNEYHSILLPALSMPEGRDVYAGTMRRVAITIAAFDLPLVILVSVASWLLARVSVAPLLAARERERAFLADVAHELRSPLTTIASMAQVTRSGEPETAEALGVIAKTALDAGDIVADLLTLARTPDPRLLVCEPVDLAAVVTESVREFRSRAGDAHVTIDVVAGSAFVNGDVRRLRELLRNLLENALYHARTCIDVRCGTEGDRAVLIVRDDGTGVAEEVRETLFERFVQSRKERGTGLGLAIARWVAQSHHGSIRVEDARPGARFVVEIPLVA